MHMQVASTVISHHSVYLPSPSSPGPMLQSEWQRCLLMQPPWSCWWQWWLVCCSKGFADWTLLWVLNREKEDSTQLSIVYPKRTTPTFYTFSWPTVESKPEKKWFIHSWTVTIWIHWPGKPQYDDPKGSLWHSLVPTTHWVHPVPETPCSKTDWTLEI